jgi:hypothetical protein
VRRGWAARVWGEGAAQRGAAALIGPRETRLASGPAEATAWHGRRVGPESVSASGARWAMTSGPRPSATAETTRAQLGRAGPEAKLPKKCRERKRSAGEEQGA